MAFEELRELFRSLVVSACVVSSHVPQLKYNAMLVKRAAGHECQACLIQILGLLGGDPCVVGVPEEPLHKVLAGVIAGNCLRSNHFHAKLPGSVGVELNPVREHAEDARASVGLGPQIPVHSSRVAQSWTELGATQSSELE